MNRMETVAGVSLLALVAAGVGQKYNELSKLASTPPPVKIVLPKIQVETRPERTVDTAISAFLSNAEVAAERPPEPVEVLNDHRPVQSARVRECVQLRGRGLGPQHVLPELVSRMVHREERDERDEQERQDRHRQLAGEGAHARPAPPHSPWRCISL